MKTQEIADFLSAELVGDDSVEISGIGSIDASGVTDIAFVDQIISPVESKAACLIVSLDFNDKTSQPIIRTKNPKLAFAKIAKKLQNREPQFCPTVVAETAKVKTEFIGAFVTIGDHSYVGDNCQIGDGVHIGKNVSIGENSVIYPNCVIYDRVEIGSNCSIHAGTVIGSDGFGYVKDDDGEHVQFPQIGNVEIGDNVEIGANCTIDRGSLGVTRIGNGTKIDNLVHIAHNVQIGKRVLIAGQSGIAGSSVIEDDVVIAGQVGIADHVTIRTGSVIGAKSSVFPNKILRAGMWSGIPVRPMKEYARQIADLKSIEKLKAEVKELKKLAK